MKIAIDTDARTLHIDDGKHARTLPLHSPEAFEVVSREWLKLGWNAKHCYTFSWMGRPVIQHPDDLVRIQEVVHRLRPDVIVETGVAHGGSLVYYASLFEAMGTSGRVIGIDVEIRPHNRSAIEAHPLSKRITLVEGDSVAPATVERVRGLVRPGEKVLVLLDSNHTKAHVLAELEAYAGLVTPGSYIVACDGIIADAAEVPRGRPEWAWDNPTAAAEAFAATHPEFVAEQPAWPFNESPLTKNVTHWAGGWLRRK